MMNELILGAKAYHRTNRSETSMVIVRNPDGSMSIAVGNGIDAHAHLATPEQVAELRLFLALTENP